MKTSKLILAALCAAAWASAPLVARAHDGDDDDGDRVVVEKEIRVERGGGRGGDRPRGGGDGCEDGLCERHGQPGDKMGGGPGDGPRGGREGQMGGPGHDPEMREKMQKLRDIERKLQAVHRKISGSPDADKAAMKPEARKLIGELFDAKLAMETAMLAKMEKHLAEMKEKISKKKSSREKMIDNKLARIMGENDDWD